MQLRRLRSPRVCCLHSGEPGKPIVQLHSMFESLRTRGADGVYLKAKVRRRLMLQLKQAGKRGMNLPFAAFCCVWSSSGWMRPSHIGEGWLLY